MHLLSFALGFACLLGLTIDDSFGQNVTDTTLAPNITQSIPATANDTISVLLRLNCTKYVDFISLVNLKSTIQDREMTIFAPTNEAFEYLNDQQKYTLAENLNTVYFVVLNHVIVDQLVPSSDLQDNTEVKVGLSGTAHIDVKRTRNERHIWVRGRRVTKRNIYSDYGIIHLVDGIMFPPSSYKPPQLLQSMESFSMISQFILDTNLTFPSNRYTFFAPTDEAFNKLPDFQMDLLKRDNKTKLEMLYNLMIPNQIFSGPITTKPGLYFTVNRRILVMKMDRNDVHLQQPSDRFGVARKRIKILSRDIELGTGLIHTIDGVVFPPPQYTLLELLKEFGMTLFAAIVEKEDFARSLQRTFPRYTMFVPSNRAMKRLPRSIRSRLESDRKFRRHVLQLHMYRGIHLMQNINTHRVIVSESDDRALVFNHNRGKSINIMQATVISQDLSASNGVMNVIDEVLIPQKYSVTQTLKRNILPTISVFSTALQTLDIIPSLNEYRYIVFAPTDDAFHRLPPESFPYLMKNPDILRKILLYHIIPGYIYAEVLSTRWVYSFRTLFNGTRIKVHRRGSKPSDFHVLDYSNRYVQASGLSLDNPCSDGIINIIDRIVIPRGINILPPSNNSIPLLPNKVSSNEVTNNTLT